MEMNCSLFFMSSFYHSIQYGDRGRRGAPDQRGAPPGQRPTSTIVSQLLNIDRMMEIASASILSESTYV